jgi:hypothetical protein
LTITQYSSDEDSESTQLSVTSGASDKKLNRSSTSAFAEVVRAARLKAEEDAASTTVAGKTT